MSEVTDIPLNAAGKPRIADRKVTRLDDRIHKQQLLFMHLIVKLM